MSGGSGLLAALSGGPGRDLLPSLCGTTRITTHTALLITSPICRIRCIQLHSRVVSTAVFLIWVVVYSLCANDCAALFDRESTPPSPSSHSSGQDPPDYLSHENDLSDEEPAETYDTQQASHGYLRRSVYDSRIEQILHENPEMPILITDAGKNHESGGSFIVYTIRTGVCLKKRRVLCWK